jgi:RNA polymerase sigma-70 factor (ECF subfamily)
MRLAARFGASLEGGGGRVQHDEEQEWLDRARDGDRQAFAALVDRYWVRIYRHLYGLTQHRQTAEDLTQEAFLKAWRALPGFRGDCSFRPWLFHIARNCLLDSRRAAGRKGVVVHVPEMAASSEAGPVATALAHEGESLFQQACGRLPIGLRSAFLLWSQEGLSHAQIAEALGITEETARWRVCKARHLLLGNLGSYLDRESS